MFHSQGSLDAINICISGQLEEMAGVVKLELYTDQLYIKVGDLRMYDHGFIYIDICY